MKNKKIPIIRIHRYWQDESQTSGACTVLIDGFPVLSSLSLERGWRNNERNVSCIPSGEYDLKFEYSDKFERKLWEIKDVPNRSECKFHSANYWFQLQGCVALGLKSKDINRDNYRDVTNSTFTMNNFHKVLEGYEEARLVITTEENVF